MRGIMAISEAIEEEEGIVRRKIKRMGRKIGRND